MSDCVLVLFLSFFRMSDRQGSWLNQRNNSNSILYYHFFWHSLLTVFASLISVDSYLPYFAFVAKRKKLNLIYIVSQFALWLRNNQPFCIL